MVESPSRRDIEHFRELTDRILTSSQLNRSIRLSKLFQYLCERVLVDDIQEIHELELGENVFGRAPRYDTMADNIVRVHASMLRKRLAEYFRTEGRDEEYIVEIPRGNYAPVFRRRTPEEIVTSSTEAGSPLHSLAIISADTQISAPDVQEPHPADTATIPVTHEPKPGNTKLWIAIVFATGFALLSCILYIRRQRISAASAASSGLTGQVSAFWSAIFPSNRTTDVVMDDASLGLYEEATNQPIPSASTLTARTCGTCSAVRAPLNTFPTGCINYCFAANPTTPHRPSSGSWRKSPPPNRARRVSSSLAVIQLARRCAPGRPLSLRRYVAFIHAQFFHFQILARYPPARFSFTVN